MSALLEHAHRASRMRPAARMQRSRPNRGATMPDVDVSRMKAALSAVEQRLHARRSGGTANFAPAKVAFQSGLASRARARGLLTVKPDRPFAPGFITLQAPFLIWALRDATEASNILVDSHIEPMNSWARISFRDKGTISADQRVNFYFLWRNNVGGDVVVDVSTALMLNGFCEVTASHGWIWTPFWGASTIGHCDMTVTAELTVLEWWNEPPTEPLHEPGQSQDVVTLSADGGWGFASPGQTRNEYISNNYHLNYDTFAIPRDSVALFEVSLVASYVGYKGTVLVDFASYDGAMILCPSVELEVVNALPGGLTVVDGGMT
jgi:hypothetical protein